MASLIWFVHQPLVIGVLKGALTGWISAAAVDIHAFFSWKSAHDFATYGWSLALWRWLQGILSGALTGAGLGALIG